MAAEGQAEIAQGGCRCCWHVFPDRHRGQEGAIGGQAGCLPDLSKGKVVVLAHLQQHPLLLGQPVAYPRIVVDRDAQRQDVQKRTEYALYAGNGGGPGAGGHTEQGRVLPVVAGEQQAPGRLEQRRLGHAGSACEGQDVGAAGLIEAMLDHAMVLGSFQVGTCRKAAVEGQLRRNGLGQ